MQKKIKIAKSKKQYCKHAPTSLHTEYNSIVPTLRRIGSDSIKGLILEQEVRPTDSIL